MLILHLQTFLAILWVQNCVYTVVGQISGLENIKKTDENHSKSAWKLKNLGKIWEKGGCEIILHSP